MKFEVATHLTPEEVIRMAEEYYQEYTGLTVEERGDNRLHYSGVIGVAKIAAFREHGHTMVSAETDRGVGFDVTDQTLRFLYTIPHI